MGSCKVLQRTKTQVTKKKKLNNPDTRLTRLLPPSPAWAWSSCLTRIPTPTGSWRLGSTLRGQCYKTFYDCSLRMFTISLSSIVWCLWIWLGAYHGAELKCASLKHSSLLRTFVNYGRKKLYNIGPRTRPYAKRCVGSSTRCSSAPSTGASNKWRRHQTLKSKFHLRMIS